MNHHRVFDGNGGGRDLRDRRFVVHRTRVRGAHGVRRHRANEGRNGAHFRRRACRPATVPDRRAIIREGHVEQHDFSHRLRRLRGQVIEARDDEHVRGDSPARRAHAAPESEHRQVGGPRLHERRRFPPAHPVRHHRRLSAHLIEPIPLHFGEHPVDAPLEGRRAGEATAGVIGEACELVPGGGGVGKGAVDDAVGHCAILARHGAVGLSRKPSWRCGGSRGEGGENESGNASHRVRAPWGTVDGSHAALEGDARRRRKKRATRWDKRIACRRIVTLRQAKVIAKPDARSEYLQVVRGDDQSREA